MVTKGRRSRPTSPGPEPRNRDATRERILAAVGALFAREGFWGWERTPRRPRGTRRQGAHLPLLRRHRRVAGRLGQGGARGVPRWWRGAPPTDARAGLGHRRGPGRRRAPRVHPERAGEPAGPRGSSAGSCPRTTRSPGGSPGSGSRQGWPSWRGRPRRAPRRGGGPPGRRGTASAGLVHWRCVPARRRAGSGPNRYQAGVGTAGARRGGAGSRRALRDRAPAAGPTPKASRRRPRPRPRVAAHRPAAERSTS